MNLSLKIFRLLTIAVASLTFLDSSFGTTGEKTTETLGTSQPSAPPPPYSLPSVPPPPQPQPQPPPPPPFLPPPFLPPLSMWSPHLGDISELIEANAQQLALRESGLLMDPQIYDEISDDLTLIYEQIPSLSAVAIFPGTLSSQIFVTVSDQVDVELSENRYQPWNQLKEDYDGFIKQRYDWKSLGKIGYVFDFLQPLNASILIPEIEANWPGILSAEPNVYFGDGSDIVRYAGAKWYAFTLKWGDCPAGCIYSETRLVAIENESVNELDPTEILERIEFLDLNATSIRAAKGDKINSSIIKAHFNLIAFPEITLETTVQLQYQNDQNEWIDFRYSPTLQPNDFTKEWRAIVSYPYTNITFELPFALEQAPSRSKDVLGSRYRHPHDWIEKSKFGWINDRQYPWLWHTQLGWLYLDENSSSANAWWTYDPSLGWLWLPVENIYPYIWSNRRWLWYQEGSTHPRWFFDYGINQWISTD